MRPNLRSFGLILATIGACAHAQTAPAPTQGVQVQAAPAQAPLSPQPPGVSVQIPGIPLSPTLSMPIPGFPQVPVTVQPQVPVAGSIQPLAPAGAVVQPQQPSVSMPIPGVPGGAAVSVPIPGLPGMPMQPAGKPAQAPVQQGPVQQAAPQPAAPVKPSVAELSFVIDSNVNPDASGRPSPVVVRIYELRSVAAFNKADFFSLFERDKEQLGPELVGRDELPLMPGGMPQAITTLRSETRYVGIIAAFRDIERARWRASTPIFVNQTTRMEIKLDRNEVAIRLQ